MASAVPSFVHGCVTSVMAAVLACRHLRDDGGLVPTAANTAADVLVLQFSCVRRPPGHAHRATDSLLRAGCCAACVDALSHA